MHSDAELIVRVARQMIAKHGTDALHCAEMHAEDLKSEPRAAARWLLVADAITLLSRDGAKSLH